MESRDDASAREGQPVSEEVLHRREKQLNDIVPVLAHGLVRRIERSGFSGQVRVSARAGESWGVARSQDNPTNIPNVILYPRAALLGDARLLNARFRHEIGNLNYPLDEALGPLRDWCDDQRIVPELLTVLAEAVHEATVNYLEMRNAYSDRPEENFKALYEQDIDTNKIAETLGRFAPYKQAVDLTLLYSLSRTGVIPAEQFVHGLMQAHASVRELFDAETRSLLDQAVKIAVPDRQVEWIRDRLWPRFSKLAAAIPLGVEHDVRPKKKIDVAEAQVQELQKRIAALSGKSVKKPVRPSTEKKKSAQQPKPPQLKELTPEERREQQEAKDLLAEDLQAELEALKKQLDEMRGEPEETKSAQAKKKPSLEEVAKQAEQARKQVEQATQEAQDKEQDTAGKKSPSAEDLQALKEQIEELEKLARELAETELKSDKEETKESQAEEEEAINFNIQEIGIKEEELTMEQRMMLGKVRAFAQQTSRVYRTAMRFIMTSYQRRNANFTDDMLRRMKERRYDLPAFSLYGVEAGQEFLSRQGGLSGYAAGLNGFLVNFQLPRPLARFWYKGGAQSRAHVVHPGGIEWGHFYKSAMPAIYRGIDKANEHGLYLSRINAIAQHDPKQYYYLWSAEEFKSPPESEDEDDADQEDEDQDSSDADEDADEKEDQSSSPDKQKKPRKDKSGDKKKKKGEKKGERKQECDGEGQGEGEGEGEGEGKGKGSPGKKGSGKPAGQGSEDGEGQAEGEGDANEGPESDAGGDEAEKTSERPSKPGGDQAHDRFQKGGKTNQREVGDLFGDVDPELLKQLRSSESMLESKFSSKDEKGIPTVLDLMDTVNKSVQAQESGTDQAQTRQLSALEELKRQQQTKMEAVYREKSGLNGDALHVYIEYMESMKDFIEDLKEFFIEKFKLDREYLYQRHERRGARLERGFTRNILGEKGDKIVINPRSFERRRPPAKPQIVWSVIIDNSGSCQGEIIVQEKKLAVALNEVAQELDIPFELLTFGGADGFQFLKTFEQDLSGEDLQTLVLLNADQGTPDVVTLTAACASMTRFTDKFHRSYNFVYFMTDGESGDGSIQKVIDTHQRDMVMTGIGLAGAASTIAKTWGKNALGVPEIRNLSASFLRKMEDQIDATFD